MVVPGNVSKFKTYSRCPGRSTIVGFVVDNLIEQTVRTAVISVIRYSTESYADAIKDWNFSKLHKNIWFNYLVGKI